MNRNWIIVVDFFGHFYLIPECYELEWEEYVRECDTFFPEFNNDAPPLPAYARDIDIHDIRVKEWEYRT